MIGEGSPVLEHWHEFYLLAGTAAVTMVALLYVALALHLEALLRPDAEHLLTHARQTMLSFIFVLLVSLMFLVPGQGPGPLGVAIGMLALVVLGLTLFTMLRARAAAHHHREHVGFIRRRSRLLLIAYLATALIGATMALERNPYASYWMIGLVCMLLGNAAGSSWDLLVQVGRIKATLASAETR